MPIQYRCPECRQLLSITSRKAGHQIVCPSCNAEHVVPTPKGTEQNPEEASASNKPIDPALGETEPFELPDAPEESLGSGAPDEPAIPPAQRRDDDEEFDDDLVFHRPDHESDEMDLTPMVDCVFLLLIFFMITASFSIQKTIEVPPPDPDKQGAAQSVQTLDDLEETSVIVQIDERNAIFVDDVPLNDPTELADTLRDKMYSEQKNELVVEAHAQAFHETVVAVEDAANEVQFQKVRLATAPGSDPD